MSGGELVVIKRSGRDGMRYPMPSGCVRLGRDADCHIRVLLPTVSQLHASVTVHRNQSVITNESSTGSTLVNGAPVSVRALRHGDIITLGDRSLRWEYYRPADVKTDNLPPELQGSRGRRRRGRGGGRARASEAAPRRLEPEVKALLDMRHRASLPGGERQVAIVQPQRRGESASEPAEIKTKAPTKPTNKRTSRATKAGPSNANDPIRKSARGANSPSSHLDTSAGTSKAASPRKALKKPAEPSNDVDESTAPKNAKITRNSKNNQIDEETSPKKTTPKKQEPPKKTSPKKGETTKKKTPVKSQNESAKQDIKMDSPRKSDRKPTMHIPAAKKGSPRNMTPRNVSTPTKSKLGLDFSNVTPTDLAVVAARGTPKRATPKGPFVHVSTPRPKTPYVELSPSWTRSKVGNALGAPRVNPLLRAATATRTPRSLTKKPVTPKPASPRKRDFVEKIEDPTSIDDQKKSALMALTGRSPKRGLTPPAPSAKFIISKASIKKISPSRSSPVSARNSRKKRMTGTPKLTPGAPRAGGSRRYTAASDVDGGAQRVSLRKSTVSEKVITNNTPTKLQETNDTQSSPSRSTRRTQAATPPIIQVSEPSPRKSVLKSPSSNSPRKNESIKFDLSNLERKKSVSLPPSPQAKDSPKALSPRKRGRSSVTSADTTSEEDLLLRYSTDESTGSESPSPRRSIHSRSKTLDESVRETSVSSGRLSRTRSPLTKSPETPRKSSRGTYTVQKVLETPVAMSPSPSDQSVRSTYSRRSTLTKTRVETSYTAQSPSGISKNLTLTGTLNVQSPRSTRQESYSIVDLVSIDSTRSVDETDTSYDSASSINSIYKTPTARKTPLSRGRSLVSLSLETSTPLANRSSRLSTRSTLLKSVTIASAIKRSRSTPNTATKVSSPSCTTRNTPSKTPTRRSKSLSLSPKLVNETVEKGGSRSKTQIIIDDSALTDANDTTITPSFRISRSGITSTSKTPSPPKNTPVQSPKPSRTNKSIEEFPNVNPTRSLRKSQQSPTPGPSGRSSRSGQTPVDTRKTASPLSASKKSGRKSASPKSPSKKSGSKSASPKIISSKSAKSPSPNKRRSVSLNDASASKRRLTFRSSKTSPRCRTDKSGSGDGPRTPENETSTLEAGTPVLHIQDLLNRSQVNKSMETLSSVKVTVQRMEALNTPKTAERLRKMTRKTLGGIGERILARRSDLEAQSGRKAWSDTKKRGQGITKAETGVKANLRAFKKVLASDQGNSDDNSVSSDKTDENAPRPDNEIVITPKSSIQPVQEAVKEKHSTAKKSTSRKSIIDHLNESQEIAKQLFNSPVKRKLSQSMTHYSQVSDDEPNTSRRSGSRRSTFGKTPNVSFDFDSVKTPRVPTEVFVSPMDTPFPSSPNLVGVRRLYAKNTPRNDLTNVRGVKALLKTPRTKKSPRNDLTNVAGVKALLGSAKKGKSPKNDLTKISGVKQLFGSLRSRRSPKNDLAQVVSVKELFASGSKKQKSPQNDLRNVAGVKKLLTSPKGKQKSPKNDLTDVRGVRSVFRRDRSTRNALDDVSGVEELFSNTNSTVRDSDNTMTEFDKLTGRTPKKMYGGAKSMSGKKTTPAKLRPTKSMDVNLSINNVEEWLDQEIQNRTKNARNASSSKKSVSKKLSTSLQNTSKASTRTPNKSIKITQPKSARVERALKKLTIDAVGGNIAITPDRRSRRAITAEKSSYSFEVAKALTPTKNRTSIPKIVVEHNSLPFKKRGHSNENASKTPKRKKTEEVNLDDSTEALGLNDAKDRLLLPMKKRVKNHEALGHSTPVKKKARSTKADDGDSVDLGPVSPIATSPNVTPRKNTSLREARKTVEQTKESIISAQKQTKNDSIQEPQHKVTKKAPARGRRGKAQESTTSEETKSTSSDKAAPKTRGRRSAKNYTANTTEATTSAKRPTRGRRAAENKPESPKKVVGKKAPKMSPQKLAATTTRGRKTAQVQEESTPKSPEKVAPKTRGRKGRKDTSLKADVSYPSLVVGKKAPTMSPEKPQPKTRTKRGVDKTSQVELSPKKAEPKTRGRKTATPKKASPKETGPKKVSPKKASPKKASPKKTRGKKLQMQEGPESSGQSTPVQRKRKRANENVESPKNKATRGGRAKATVAESPKGRRGKKVQTSDQKRVHFDVGARETPVRRAGGRRKAEPVGEEEATKPQAKRGRAGKTAVEASPPASEAGRTTRRGRAAAATSAVTQTGKGRATRQRK